MIHIIGIFCFVEVLTALLNPLLGTTPLLVAWLVNYALHMMFNF